MHDHPAWIGRSAGDELARRPGCDDRGVDQQRRGAGQRRRGYSALERRHARARDLAQRQQAERDEDGEHDQQSPRIAVEQEGAIATTVRDDQRAQRQIAVAGPEGQRHPCDEPHGEKRFDAGRVGHEHVHRRPLAREPGGTRSRPGPDAGRRASDRACAATGRPLRQDARPARRGPRDKQYVGERRQHHRHVLLSSITSYCAPGATARRSPVPLWTCTASSTQTSVLDLRRELINRMHRERCAAPDPQRTDSARASACRGNLEIGTETRCQSSRRKTGHVIDVGIDQHALLAVAAIASILFLVCYLIEQGAGVESTAWTPTRYPYLVRSTFTANIVTAI